MTEDEFERHFRMLGQHLGPVRPIFRAFCEKHGFEEMQRTAIGRYPRIRCWKQGIVEPWIDLWMSVDNTGKRFETFSEKLPYELSAGSSFQRKDQNGQVWRYSKCFAIWEKPGDVIAEGLLEDLEGALDVIGKWDAGFLEKHGEGIRLRSQR